MTYPSQVPLIVNGVSVDAANTNAPINALIQRTDWLKAQLAALSAGTNLVLRNQPVQPGTASGTPVFYNDTNLRFEPALAGVVVNAYNASTPASYYQGVAVNVSGATCDVVLAGVTQLLTTAWASVIDTGSFSVGDYFLSELTAGKLTKDSGSFGVYVGHLRADGTLLLKATTGDTYLDHIHLQEQLLGKPAGTSPEPTIGNPQQITVTDLNQRGWLPKSAFLAAPYNFTDGVQIPAGVKFGYHIQHPSETSLRAIFPPVPPESSTLVQGGLVLEPGVKFIVNQFGIWWLTDGYGEAPWPVDYATSATAPNLYLWSVRIPGAISVAEQVANEVIQQLATGTLAELGVTGVRSADQALLGVSGTTGDNTTGFKGLVTLTNNGVTQLRPERGVAVTATAGDATSGFRGTVTLTSTAEYSASLLHNTAGAKVVVSTNGFPSGSTLGLRADPLGASGTDAIDYELSVGSSELPAGVDYYVQPTFYVAVDVATPLVAAGTFTAEFYRVANGGSLSDVSLIHTAQVQVPVGSAAGQLRIVTLSLNSNLVTQRARLLIVRIKNGTGGSPLANGILRVLGVKYTFVKV